MASPSRVVSVSVLAALGLTAFLQPPSSTGSTATAPSAAAAASSGPAAQWRTSRIGVVADRRITEGSGLTRSTYRRDVFYVHNDSGDYARFFALNRRGRTLATYTLRNAPSQDWEDVAAGPYHRLWFGDIGDNFRRKSTISVVRVTEPRRVRAATLSSRTFRLRYRDGRHNAEGLMVHPETGRLYVVTKSRRGPGHIYRAPLPLRAGSVNRLVRVGQAPSRVTGADFGPYGNRFVLRTYTRAYVYSRIGGRPHRVLRLPSNGESVGFNRFGNAIILHSEGARRSLWRLMR